MHTKILVIFSISSVFFLACPAYSSPSGRCIPRGKIKIACTDQCQAANEIALKETARKLGYEIEMHALRSKGVEFKVWQKMHGILVEGGADIDFEFYRNRIADYELNPFYGEQVNPGIDPERQSEFRTRDAFEYRLLRQYFTDQAYQSIPLLGICRGMQMLTVANRIPLYVDIKKQLGVPAFDGSMEPIKIHKNAILLNRIFVGKELVHAFERHHQALHLDYFLQNQAQHPEIIIAAKSPDARLVEAIEFTSRPALGVQFHPELSSDAVKIPIFSWFLAKACEKTHG